MTPKLELNPQRQMQQSIARLVTPLRLASKDLLQGQQEIEIEHQGMLYRLRCTAQGKLILTK
jgi:hemin uptake protein HemP